MKKINVFALATAAALIFSSCSNEENTLEDNQTSLLKSYQIKRDATGAYSIDFDVIDNTKIDKVKDVETNINEYILSSSESKSDSKTSDELLIDNSKLEISFVDVNLDKKSSISVFDDNISIQRKAGNSKLSSYSIQENEDGTYSLVFDVKNKVDVSFVYNEEINTYEVHLEKGVGSQISFSRTFEKESGAPLKIDFVNHVNNPNAKSAGFEMIRKPKVIIDDDFAAN